MCNKFYSGEDDSLLIIEHVIGSSLQYFLFSDSNMISCIKLFLLGVCLRCKTKSKFRILTSDLFYLFIEFSPILFKYLIRQV
jgi:hypothetical protein